MKGKKESKNKPEAAKRREQGEAEKERAERERKAAESFVRGVLERGEAARTDKQGKLPPGATHEIVAEPPSGLPKIRRKRFSLT